jgi:hypothetical protein
MAQQTKPPQDPWKELAKNKGNEQVRLEEVLEELPVDSRRGFKKDLIERVEQLARTR